MDIKTDSFESSPIDSLVEKVWSECVTQRPAEGIEEANKWHKDEVAHLNDRYIVSPLPKNLKTLVEEAINQWAFIEIGSYKKTGLDRYQYLEEFEKVLELYRSGDSGWNQNLGKLIIPGIIPNQEWVNLFSWILPKADPEKKKIYKNVGRLVTAFYYAELLKKYGVKNENEIDLYEYLRKIDARWVLTNEID